jgi:hypothetical protein
MLPFLYAAERDGWYHLVTGDESRFSLNISPRCMWTLSRNDVITKPRLDIQSKIIHVYDHMESERLLYCRQIRK